MPLLPSLRSAVLCFAMLAAACSAPPDEGKPTGATCPPSSTLSYETFGREFFQTYCLRCHSSSVVEPQREGAPDDHNFDTRAEIETMREHIDLSAAAGPNATNELMPVSDPRPTLEERRRLAEWLACRAP